MQEQVQDRLRDLGESFSEKSSKLDYDKPPPPATRQESELWKERSNLLRVFVQKLHSSKTIMNELLPNNELCKK